MKTMHRGSLAGSALVCAMFGVMCDRGDESPQRPESHVEVCEYDAFEAEITAGPSAGVRLDGKLMIFRDSPTGEFTGILRTATGEVLATGALFASGDISLTFHTEGGYVMGLGRVGDNFCRAGTMLEGVAIGPKVAADNDLGASDSGHWLLKSPTLMLDGGSELDLYPSPGFGDFGDGGGFEYAKVSCKSDSIPISGSCCKKGNVTICENGGQECSFDYGVSPPTKSCSDDATQGDIVF